MKRYLIGIDGHVKFCQFCVLDKNGEKVLDTPINTTPHDLINFAKRFEGSDAIIESGAMSEWLFRLLEPYFNKFVVCDPRQNRWISASDDSDDSIDAHKLAQLLRGGFYNEVHVPEQSHQLLREIVYDYHRFTKETTRLKNHIKAKYRSRGIKATGESVYSPTGRTKWLAKLDKSRRVSIEPYYMALDYMLDVRDNIVQRLRSLSKEHPVISLMTTVPGIGFITAATYYVVVDTPWRFPRRQNLWSYCRVGLKKKTSAGKTKGGRQKGGHRILKSVLMNAAQVAIFRCKQENQFSELYKKSIARGLSEKVARRTVARHLCTTLWSMWKSGQPYREIETSIKE